MGLKLILALPSSAAPWILGYEFIAGLFYANFCYTTQQLDLCQSHYGFIYMVVAPWHPAYLKNVYRVWQLVIEHMQVPRLETHHMIYLHKYLNMFDHQQPHPVVSCLASVLTGARNQLSVSTGAWHETKEYVLGYSGK